MRAIWWVIALAAVAFLFSGRFRNCYDAKFIGASSNYLSVEDASGGRHEMHMTASPDTMYLIRKWATGDEVVVCNTLVTNKTKGESANCADFGCLSLLP